MQHLSAGSVTDGGKLPAADQYKTLVSRRKQLVRRGTTRDRAAWFIDRQLRVDATPTDGPMQWR